MAQGSLVLFVGRARLLGEVAERAAKRDHTVSGRPLTSQHPQQAGLPGTVAPDQPDLFTGAHGDAGVLDDEFAGDLNGERARLEHAYRFSYISAAS